MVTVRVRVYDDRVRDGHVDGVLIDVRERGAGWQPTTWERSPWVALVAFPEYGDRLGAILAIDLERVQYLPDPPA